MPARASRLGPSHPARVWTRPDGRIAETSPEAVTLLHWDDASPRPILDFFPFDRAVVERALDAAVRGDAVTLLVSLRPYARTPILVEVVIAPTPASEEIVWTLTRIRPI